MYGKHAPVGQPTMSKLLLLSGGVDSALCLHTVEGVSLCVGFDYGQDHVIELDFAQKLAEDRGVRFLRVTLPSISRVDAVVFAGRNAVLLSMAASIAQPLGLREIVIGCNRSDAERFPDCREEFVAAMSTALGAYGLSLSTPLLHKTKSEVVKEALGLGLAGTWSCYHPDDLTPCGACLACRGLEGCHV